MPENSELNFKQIVDDHYVSLYRFGYSLAKNEHEASDLTQQTFAIYAEKGSSIQDSSKVKSWLFTTLYREFLRIRRKSAKYTTHDNELLESEAPAVSPDVANTLDGKSAVDALNEVDEVYRAPLMLFYLKELAYKDIAQILDIPIGTVMSRLSRGKSQLKSILLSKRD